jgi:hypothetical protein
MTWLNQSKLYVFKIIKLISKPYKQNMFYSIPAKNVFAIWRNFIIAFIKSYSIYSEKRAGLSETLRKEGNTMNIPTILD